MIRIADYLSHLSQTATRYPIKLYRGEYIADLVSPFCEGFMRPSMEHLDIMFKRQGKWLYARIKRTDGQPFAEGELTRAI